MSGWSSDLRYALRALRRSPGYSLLCVAALALGVGANGAIFSLVEALMLRPQPYPQPERLVMPYLRVEGGAEEHSLGAPELGPWSFPKLETMRATQRVFSAVAGFTAESVNLTGSGAPERVEIELVSAPYFELLGVNPALGRAFAPADASRPAPVVAVIGDGLWRRRFGSDPAIVGRVLRLNDVAVTVVGVSPPGFSGLGGKAELWVPVTAAAHLWYPEALDEAQNHWLQAVARVRPGVSAEALRAEMERIGRLLATEYPIDPEYDDGTRWTAATVALAEARRDPFIRRALAVLLGAVGTVLLIACANLASLSLVRGARRRRELAIRSAVGASGGRLARQLLVENAVLGIAGGAAAVATAVGLVRALATLRPESLDTWGLASAELADLATAGVGLPVAGFCLAGGLLTALVFGLAPALRARRSPAPHLREVGGVIGFRGGSGPFGGRQLLVAGQMALALVTLTGAGLLLRSLWALQRVELGFDPERVVTFVVSPVGDEYRREQTPLFMTRLLDAVGAVPGVRAAALGSCIPASGEAGCNSTIVLSRDGERLPLATAPSIGWHMVSADYFRTLGIPLRAGRPFDGRDRQGSPRVVILNETAARRLWPDGDAVGRRLQMGTAGLNGEVHGEVVGVVADVRYRRLGDAPSPEAYLPALQAGYARTTVFLHTAGDPLAAVPALRAAVRRVDPDLPIFLVRTLEEQLGFALSKSRFGSLLLTVFATVALALAALGVYGVLAQLVSARRREIGVRMALGAAAGEVERLVLRQGMALALAGALAGVALSLALSGVLRGLLYEVSARDPLVFAGVPLLLLAVATLACLLPARRAARLDPTLVLRQE